MFFDALYVTDDGSLRNQRCQKTDPLPGGERGKSCAASEDQVSTSPQRGEVDARSAAGEGARAQRVLLLFRGSCNGSLRSRPLTPTLSPGGRGGKAVQQARIRFPPLPSGERSTRAARRVRGASAASVLLLFRGSCNGSLRSRPLTPTPSPAGERGKSCAASEDQVSTSPQRGEGRSRHRTPARSQPSGVASGTSTSSRRLSVVRSSTNVLPLATSSWTSL